MGGTDIKQLLGTDYYRAIIGGSSPSGVNPFATVSQLGVVASMNTNKLLGRYTAGLGVAEEITIGSGLSLSGLGVLTATGSVTSVSGTANRITSTGGATPVIDISAAYVGQNSITTLGTVTTGTWNGSAIAGLYLVNTGVTGQALTGYVSGAGVITGLDTILTAIQKLNGNIAANSYTFSTGLTNTVGTITNNLSTGVAGGQSIFGGSAASEILTINSTSNPTKGRIQIGSTDLVNIGNATSANQRILRVGQGTHYIDLGNRTDDSSPAIYFSTVTPSPTNYHLTGGATSVIVNAPTAGSNMNFRVANVDRCIVTNTTATYSFGTSSVIVRDNGANPGFGAIYFNASTNAALTGTTTQTMLNATTSNTLQVGGFNYVDISSGAVSINSNATVFTVNSTRSSFVNKAFFGGSTVPTALIHAAAGGISANSAPLKLTTQAAGLTTPEQGVFELIGSTLHFTNSTIRRSQVQGSTVSSATIQVANTTTETTVFTTSVGASELTVGKQIELFLCGLYTSNSGAGANTLTVRVKYAGTTILTLVTVESANTDQLFRLLATLTCRTTGATGTLQSSAIFDLNGVATKPQAVALPTIDTTTAQNITITAQWSDANASNDIRFQQARALWVNNNL